jgi:hypothetical protein
VIRAHNVRYRLARWVTPDGRTLMLMATKTRTYLANTHDRAGLLRMAVVHQQVSYGE